MPSPSKNYPSAGHGRNHPHCPPYYWDAARAVEEQAFRVEEEARWSEYLILREEGRHWPSPMFPAPPLGPIDNKALEAQLEDIQSEINAFAASISERLNEIRKELDAIKEQEKDQNQSGK